MDAVRTAGEVVGTLLAFCTLLGLLLTAAGKWIIVPWLERRFAPVANQVAAQLQDVHHQVTVNGHVSQEPTMLDKLDSTRAEVRELKGETRRDLADMRMDIHTVGRVYDRHVDWSAAETGRLWEAIQRLDARHRSEDGNPAEDERNET